MSVTSKDFGGSAPRGLVQTGFGERRVRLLPPLTAEQIAQLERAMAESGLPARPDDGRGTARMLGLAALTGLGMVTGGVCALWLLIAPI